MIDKGTLWLVIIGLGVGSYTMRFLFLGFIGNREMPEWFLRHLRYTAVAVLPGLVAPLVVWPEATGGNLDAPRLIAAVVTIIASLVTRNIVLSIILGALSLYGGLYLLG
ncbi:Branched-chain amino acid transport protein (AzlD) [Roseovarius albus]|uniref:Branched-chain amino acid transport protein (AzlD) n=1 Tax=Roseovarius albus TaxID=1247867 RepID=A0A1X6ZY79_9RHOB|nr:AzlD domain-containing protein [Roseovarius albus]SLN63327.1 Branched-chain amino acid transport protein (AzlD) [Roseovarius albus]